MPDQPAEETPQQIVERELRAAQEQVRRVSEQLRAALAEEAAKEDSQDSTKDEH